MRILDAADYIRHIIDPYVSTPRFIPARILSSDLPVGLVVARAGAFDDYTGARGKQRRTFEVQLYVKPVSQGTLDAGYNEAVTTLDAVGKALVDARRESECPSWLQRATFTDTGHAILSYAGNDYHGAIITVETYLPLGE